MLLVKSDLIPYLQAQGLDDILAKHLARNPRLPYPGKPAGAGNISKIWDSWPLPATTVLFLVGNAPRGMRYNCHTRKLWQKSGHQERGRCTSCHPVAGERRSQSTAGG